MPRDYVDSILEQWVRERPDLDVSPMAVMVRLLRVARHLERALQATYASFDLNSGEFDVLTALRLERPTYHLSPTDLFKSLMLSSGAMTNRIDRLEQAGLVVRRLDPQDRRGVLVALTSEGHRVVDGALATSIASQQRLLATLEQAERERLANLLRKLLLSFEGATSRHDSTASGEELLR